MTLVVAFKSSTENVLNLYQQGIPRERKFAKLNMPLPYNLIQKISLEKKA